MPHEIAFHDKEAQEFLEKTIQRINDVKGAQQAFCGVLSAVIFRDIIDHFEKELGPDGKWQPWSKIYLEHMTKIGKQGNKILQDSGRLRNAFKPTNYRKVTEGIMWYNDAKTKSGFPYAYAHNEGGDRLPARTFMWASPEASENISQLTLKFVLDA